MATVEATDEFTLVHSPKDPRVLFIEAVFEHAGVSYETSTDFTKYARRRISELMPPLLMHKSELISGFDEIMRYVTDHCGTRYSGEHEDVADKLASLMLEFGAELTELSDASDAKKAAFFGGRFKTFNEMLESYVGDEGWCFGSKKATAADVQIFVYDTLMYRVLGCNYDELFAAQFKNIVRVRRMVGASGRMNEWERKAEAKYADLASGLQMLSMDAGDDDYDDIERFCDDDVKEGVLDDDSDEDSDEAAELEKKKLYLKTRMLCKLKDKCTELIFSSECHHADCSNRASSEIARRIEGDMYVCHVHRREMGEKMLTSLLDHGVEEKDIQGEVRVMLNKLRTAKDDEWMAYSDESSKSLSSDYYADEYAKFEVEAIELLKLIKAESIGSDTQIRLMGEYVSVRARQKAVMTVRSISNPHLTPLVKCTLIGGVLGGPVGGVIGYTIGLFVELDAYNKKSFHRKKRKIAQEKIDIWNAAIDKKVDAKEAVDKVIKTLDEVIEAWVKDAEAAEDIVTSLKTEISEAEENLSQEVSKIKKLDAELKEMKENMRGFNLKELMKVNALKEKKAKVEDDKKKMEAELERKRAAKAEQEKLVKEAKRMRDLKDRERKLEVARAEALQAEMEALRAQRDIAQYEYDYHHSRASDSGGDDCIVL